MQAECRKARAEAVAVVVVVTVLFATNACDKSSPAGLLVRALESDSGVRQHRRTGSGDRRDGFTVFMVG